MSDSHSPLTLGAIFYEGFELLDVYGPLEMFGSVGPELRIVTVAQKAGAVTSTQGPKTLAQYGFDDCPVLDLILLPGGVGTLQRRSQEKGHDLDKSSVVIPQGMEQYDDQLGGAVVRHYSIHWSGALPRPGVSCRILASLSSTPE